MEKRVESQVFRHLSISLELLLFANQLVRWVQSLHADCHIWGSEQQTKHKKAEQSKFMPICVLTQ